MTSSEGSNSQVGTLFLTPTPFQSFLKSTKATKQTLSFMQQGKPARHEQSSHARSADQLLCSLSFVQLSWRAASSSHSCHCLSSTLPSMQSQQQRLLHVFCSSTFLTWTANCCLSSGLLRSFKTGSTNQRLLWLCFHCLWTHCSTTPFSQTSHPTRVSHSPTTSIAMPSLTEHQLLFLSTSLTTPPSPAQHGKLSKIQTCEKSLWLSSSFAASSTAAIKAATPSATLRMPAAMALDLFVCLPSGVPPSEFPASQQQQQHQQQQSRQCRTLETLWPLSQTSAFQDQQQTFCIEVRKHSHHILDSERV